MQEELKTLYDRIRLRFGASNQKVKCIEECAELQKEIAKNIAGDHNSHHIAEEIADVQIMCEQMINYYGIEDLVNLWRENKLARIRKILEDNNARNMRKL